MRQLLYLTLALAILFTGCSKHQYFTFSSDLPKTSNDLYYYESDSLKIEYNFTSSSSIEVTVHNKSDNPILINWEKSSIIFNNESLAMANGDLNFKGSGSSLELFEDVTYSDFHGTIKGGKNQTFLPPQAFVANTFNKVPLGYQKRLKREMDFEKMYFPDAVVKKYSFDKSQPLAKLKSYLYIENPDESAFNVSHDFWVSEILETNNGKLKLGQNHLKQSKVTTTGAILGTTGVVGLLVVAAAAEESN
ncbi:hypothetical protein [Roseivirga pacifica]|uniref:hypothetical protein n=1 Tax=Roseivirga pacifica TaxID=1267423 RepID=UPI003BA8F1C6